MLQIYTGAGKGKTTAAFGLAVRALGAGMRVYIMQFMKGLAYSEQGVLRAMDGITLATTGKPFFVAAEGMLSEEDKAKWGDGVVIFPPGKPPADYVRLLADGLEQARAELASGKYGLVILDELNVALFFGLITRPQAEAVLEAVPEGTELVLTGRNAPEWLIERADLVTEMREIKHYYKQGVEARRGIEN